VGSRTLLSPLIKKEKKRKIKERAIHARFNMATMLQTIINSFPAIFTSHSIITKKIRWKITINSTTPEKKFFISLLS